MSEEISLKRKLNESEQKCIDLSKDLNDSLLEEKSKLMESGVKSGQKDNENQFNDQNKSNGQMNETLSEQSDESLAKKLKKETLYDNVELSLSLVTLKKVIDIRYIDKSAVLEGEYKDERVLIFIEKLPFDETIINKLFAEPFELKKIIQNNIYGSYSLEPKIENKIKTTIICPATDRHFEKYLRSQYVMIDETAERYETITLPYLQANKFSIDWVYNILEHKQESERIVFEDEDDDNGFVLLPDLKWDGINVKKLYLIAIVKKRGIKSIRDLTGEHLLLLKNIKEKSYKAIKDKYDIESDKLQAYFHYQPSYYHLHIHFNTIHFEHPRLYIGSSHLLDTVITNIEIDSNYYKKATLNFRLKCSNSLNEYYKNKLNANVHLNDIGETNESSDKLGESKVEEVTLVE